MSWTSFLTWFIAIAVVLVLSAVAWWSSGRAKPLVGSGRPETRTERYGKAGQTSRDVSQAGGGGLSP